MTGHAPKVEATPAVSPAHGGRPQGRRLALVFSWDIAGTRAMSSAVAAEPVTRRRVPV